MIVSWLFSERKEKKNANRSIPCILVQNLGVSWKRTHSSSFLLSLSPDAGERWLGCGGFRLLPSLPPFKEREVRGCSRQIWRKPIRDVRERGMFVLGASRGPPFWGWWWRKPAQVLELRIVGAQWQRWDWWVGRVCLGGTVQREERGGGRARSC